MGANVADFSVIRDAAFFVMSPGGGDAASFNFDFRGGVLLDLEGISHS